MKFDLQLEPALRYMARNPREKLEYVAQKFRLPKADIEKWLKDFNRGNCLVTNAKIDEAKSLSGAVSITPVTKLTAPQPAAAAQPVAIKPIADIDAWLSAQRAKVSGRVVVHQVEVTPPLATAWLKFNTGNRNPSKAKIRRFAVAMAAGRWQLNGESLKFSVTGRLLDGQSRLMAMLESRMPVVIFEIRAGLPDKAQESMDVGEVRKGSHTLEMMGENYPGVLAPALKQCWLLDNDNMVGGKSKTRVMENFDIGPLLKKHHGLKASVGWIVTAGKKVDRLMPWSTAAFFHYIFGAIDAHLRDIFFEALLEGTGLTKQSPIYHLRERLMDDREKRYARGLRLEHTALTIKAWNAAYRGEKMTGIRWAEGETFPEIDGLQKVKAA